MKLRSLVSGGLLLRTIAKELKGIRYQLQRQADSLDRLAGHYAPPVEQPRADSAALQETGVSFLDPIEMQIAQDFISRMESSGQGSPTEEEVLTYLADEKTVDLQKRLLARERELYERLQQERADGRRA